MRIGHTLKGLCEHIRDYGWQCSERYSVAVENHTKGVMMTHPGTAPQLYTISNWSKSSLKDSFVLKANCRVRKPSRQGQIIKAEARSILH
jgi:hypothetical protein